MIQQRRKNATILRPWQVGPGHRWAYALLPFCKAAELLPFTREGACRLCLVTLPQVLALAEAIEAPAQGVRVLGVPDIRAWQLKLSPDRARQTA